MSNKTTYSPDNIQFLSWQEAIRKRPGMYMGSVDIRGFILTLKNIFSNTLIMSKANYVQMTLKENCSANLVFKNVQTPLPDSWSVDPNNNSFYASYFLALPVINALSSKFNITFFDKKGKLILAQTFEKGDIKKGKIQGTVFNCFSMEINFELDQEIWKDNLVWNPHHIFHQIKNFSYLYKNVKFDLLHSLEGIPCRSIYHFKNGLKDRIDLENLNRHLENQFPIYLEKKFDTFYLELALSFYGYSFDSPFFKLYVNDLLTPLGGTHEKGLISGMRVALKKYVELKYPNKKYIFSKKKITAHLVAALNIRIQQPIFVGSTRHKLGSPEVVNPISSLVADSLFDLLASNDQYAERLIYYFETT